ncbi:MAG: DUF892 family protein [Sphingomonadaceae bacterium]
MPATADSSTEIAKLLKELVHLDYDAIEAYEAAIERLEDPRYKQRLSEFCGDHRRHTENLAGHLRQLGEDVPEGPDLKRVLTEGKVVLAGLAGDKAILTAMRANEEVTNKAYEKALEKVDANAAIEDTLRANLADERRHRAWLKESIEALG